MNANQAFQRALGASVQYTEDSLLGAGALKGAPCEITKIEEVDAGINVEFKWVDSAGATHAETKLFPKGEKGDKGDTGPSVDSAIVKNGHLVLTKDDGTEIDCGLLPTSDYDDSELRGLIGVKVDKVIGKSLVDDTEIARLSTVDNYDDTTVKQLISNVADGLMDSVGYSADYKTLDIIDKNGNKKSVDVKPVIEHANLEELADVDGTNKGNGKVLVYNEATGKNEYSAISGTDELVKMDSSSDPKHLGDLIDKVTVVNESGVLKVKKLDGQEATVDEINYLKGLTMNVMDLVSLFATGGLKTLDSPFNTYADLTAFDKSTLLDEVSYLTRVLSDETHENKITAYLIKKEQESPIFYGYLDDSRNFITNPINLVTEITGKLGVGNMDVDALATLLAVSVDDTYKTLTSTDNSFGTHGAKALYDELVSAIGVKANTSDLTTHTSDTSIHVSSTEKETWNKVVDKAESTDLVAHTGDTGVHVTTQDKANWNNAQANIIETVKVNGSALPTTDKAVDITVPTKISQLTNDSGHLDEEDITTIISSASTDKQVPSAKATYDALNNKIDKSQNIILSTMENGSYTRIRSYSNEAGDYISLDIVDKNGRIRRFQFNNGETIKFPEIFEFDGTSWKIVGNICITSVYDVPKTTLTPVSPNVNFTNYDSECYYYVINGICYVTLWSMNITANLSVETLFNNLPTAKAPTQFLLSNSEGSETVGMGWTVAGGKEIACNAMLKGGTTISTGYARFSYPVA